MPGSPIGLQGRGDNRLHAAEADRMLQGTALAEAAAPRATPHDLDGDPLVNAFDEAARSGPGGSAAASRSCTTAGSIAGGTSSRVGRNPAGRPSGIELRLVEPRHVDIGQCRGQAGQGGRSIEPGLPHFQPQVAHRRQGLFAVAQHEGVDESGHRLGVGRAGAAGQNQRIGHGSRLGRQWNSAQIEHRQHVRRAEFVLQAEADDVELPQRRETLQADQRQSPFRGAAIPGRPGA